MDDDRDQQDQTSVRLRAIESSTRSFHASPYLSLSLSLSRINNCTILREGNRQAVALNHD